MKPHVFISYPVENEALIENFAESLRELGIIVWVYSLHRTLAVDLWQEIEERIAEAEVFVFVASGHTRDAAGQHRELQIALDQIATVTAERRAVPLVVDNLSFQELPPELRHTNGLRIDVYTVKSTAMKFARSVFPELFESEQGRDWKCPKPGQWLEVCMIDAYTEEYFERGDLVYFRRLSPLGLFECYAPRINALFWFAPQNLRMTDTVDADGARAREEVPWRFRYETSYECERLGYEEMEKCGRIEDDT